MCGEVGRGSRRPGGGKGKKSWTQWPLAALARDWTGVAAGHMLHGTESGPMGGHCAGAMRLPDWPGLPFSSAVHRLCAVPTVPAVPGSARPYGYQAPENSTGLAGYRARLRDSTCTQVPTAGVQSCLFGPGLALHCCCRPTVASLMHRPLVGHGLASRAKSLARPRNPLPFPGPASHASIQSQNGTGHDDANVWACLSRPSSMSSPRPATDARPLAHPRSRH